MSLRNKLSEEEWEQVEKESEKIAKRVNEGFEKYIGDRVIYRVGIDEYKGQKHSQSKLPMSKLFKQFPRALQAVVLTSLYGHNKYKETDKDWMNFSRVPGGANSYKDAEIRHQLDKEVYGQNDESGLPHIFHEAWDKLAECELWIQENNIDIKEYSKNYIENEIHTS